MASHLNVDSDCIIIAVAVEPTNLMENFWLSLNVLNHSSKSKASCGLVSAISSIIGKVMETVA